ncbi:MAG: hypothetical protein AAB152_18585 [Candidatus Coatesbacteria bacterium]
MVAAGGIWLLGRTCRTEESTASGTQEQILAGMRNANTHVRNRSSIVYTLSGRGHDIVSAERAIQTDGVPTSSVAVLLDEKDPANRLIVDEKTSRSLPFMKKLARWETWHDFDRVAANKGSLGARGRFIVSSVAFAPGTMDERAVEVTKGYYRSTYQLAWWMGRITGGYWHVVFWVYPASDDHLANQAGREIPSGRKIVVVRSLRHAGEYVRSWIRECPDLILACETLEYWGTRR